MKVKRQLDIGVFQGAGAGTVNVTVNCGSCGSNCGCDCDCACAMSAEINPVGDIAPITRYSVNPIGGSGPYEYKWDVAQADSINDATEHLINISGADDEMIVTLDTPANPSKASGLLRCKVTDANGNVTYAYYLPIVQVID